jgi:transcriptional regulator with XRE-family HTH domain
MQNFSIILIKNRLKLKLSQEEISAKVGVRQSTYHEWEKGRSPKIDYLPKLRDVLGLTSIDDFFVSPPPVIQH